MANALRTASDRDRLCVSATMSDNAVEKIN